MDTYTSQDRKVRKVVIDRKACTGAATCVILAPQAFVLDQESVATVLDTALSHTDEELVNAARGCPTQAIKLLDENGGEVSL